MTEELTAVSDGRTATRGSILRTLPWTEERRRDTRELGYQPRGAAIYVLVFIDSESSGDQLRHEQLRGR